MLSEKILEAARKAILADHNPYTKDGLSAILTAALAELPGEPVGLLAADPAVSDIVKRLRSTRSCSVCCGDGMKSNGKQCGGCAGSGQVFRYDRTGPTAADIIERLTAERDNARREARFAESVIAAQARIMGDLQNKPEEAYDSALESAAATAYRVCAETRHVTLGEKAAAAIRAMKERG